MQLCHFLTFKEETPAKKTRKIKIHAREIIINKKGRGWIDRYILR